MSTTIDGSGNVTFSGALSTTGTLAAPVVSAVGPNVPLYANSTNSSTQKIVMQDNGVNKGFLGANSSYSFIVSNAALSLSTLLVDNNGTVVAPLSFNSPSITANGAGPSLTVNSTNSSGYKINLQDNGVSRATISADAGGFHIANAALSLYTFNLDNSGNVSLTGGLSASGTVNINTTSANCLQISDSSGANIKMTGNGTVTPAKSIRAQDGNFQVINNAYNNIPLSLSDAGGLAILGSLSQNSDERIKTNWRDVQDNFVEKLSKIKYGIYDRTDIEETQVGVSAQSLQTLMPEAVKTNTNSFTGVELLSVSYGNAALVACIELAKQVEELKKEIALLKAK